MNDDIEQSEVDLRDALQIAKQSKSRVLEFHCLLTKAWFSLKSGDNPEGLQALRHAMDLGKKQGYIFTYLDYYLVTGDICAVALQHGIEIDYVTRLIVERGLVPTTSAYHIAVWPWQIRIKTLGRFQLEISGAAMEHFRRGQKKPLTLLKAIIARGGQAVGESVLSDDLWFESDGDAAHIAFTTTLHRLRHILGLKKAVVLSGGAVSIDRSLCWVDVFALDDLLRQAEENPVTGRPGLERQQQLMGQILELYQGSFLAGEDESWLLAPRERLQARVVRQLEKTAAGLEAHENWQQAAAIYESGLTIDLLKESFYQGLMRCLLTLGHVSAAQLAFKRCCQALEKNLAARLSPETLALAEKLKRLCSNKSI